MKRKMTKKNAPKVFAALTEIINAGGEDAKAVLYQMNEMLDALGDDDFWGTEGQNDPRGDQRD